MVDNLSTTSSEDAEPTMEVEPGSNPSQLAPGAADVAVTVETKEEEGEPPPLRSMSSFRARLRAGRRDPGVPVSLFQWETRGHFWSALDKAAAPKDPSQARTGVSGVLLRAWQRTKVRVKNTATVVRLRPSVLLWPLLLLAVCLAAGIVGVELGAKHYQELNKDDAAAAASEALNSLDLAWWGALQPLRSLGAHAAVRPAMADLGPRLSNISGQLLAAVGPVPPVVVVPALLLSPFGVARAAYSDPSAPPPVAAAVSALLGSSLPSLDSTVGPAQFQGVILQAPTATSSLGPLTILASQPVFIPGVAATEDWGNGPGPDGQPIASCTAPACYFVPSSAPAAGGTGTRLWGFAVGVVDVGAVAGQPNAGLARLVQLGYRYRATMRSNSSSGSPASVSPLATLDSQPAIPSAAQTIMVSAPLPGSSSGGAGGSAVLMQLEVYPEEGWQPYWRAPLLAVVVILSVAVSSMLFAALVLQHRHVMFLEAMLPKKVITVLGSGRSFYHHYDLVTVLYADIVRYSNAPTGMPAWEVVKLLNDVNNIYDNLLDKHGLVKIRRSGEAFMAVGGCPDEGDPVSVAVRVAMCAREMVMATASFRSSAGQRVQIRLGLHSGPAVAAVLGTHTPRFSLLGDTVDIAHFMESTSTIMGVHVSDTTAELLTIADDPLISLQPRGIIDIKGRGHITTSWLRIDLLAPMGTWNGEHAGGGAAGGSTVGIGSAAAKGGAGGVGAAAAAASGRGGKGAAGGSAAAAPADVACTADLAVAATLGVRGAPLVRKLSQTGLTQTRRALPDRRAREGRDVYDNSLLGSFTLRLEPETIAMVKEMLARPTPPPSPTRAAAAAAAAARRRDGAAASGGGAAAGGEGSGGCGDVDGGSSGEVNGGREAGVEETAVAAAAVVGGTAVGSPGEVAAPSAVVGGNGPASVADVRRGTEGEGTEGEGTGTSAGGGVAAGKPAGVAVPASLEIEVG